jgi:hypothetical protein
MTFRLSLERVARGVLALCLACALAATSARAIEPDYTGWSNLLQKYLKILREKGKPFDTRFDYEQLYIDENIWTKHQADGLTTLETQLLAVNPSDMTPAERTAWAINTYNFLVIERMTLYLLIPGRKFTRYDSAKDIILRDGPFFGAPMARVGGVNYSLAGFERRFVYGDTAADSLADGFTAREKPGDPRLAFALCRASLGTGPLLPWVYRADSLEKQLDRATRIALALPVYVQANEKTGELAATNRFFEDRADYGGTALTGVVPFLKKYGAPATKQFIVSRKSARVGRYFEPNPKLNQYDHPAAKPPGQSGAPPPKSN